jgi:hypothetical protein
MKENGMPSYKIRFEGLIAQVAIDVHTTRAVFIGGAHFALLAVTTGFAHNSKLMPGSIPASFEPEVKAQLAGKTLFKLIHETLALNTTVSPVTVDPTFNRVPSLTRALYGGATKSLHQEIFLQTPHAAVQTYVTFSGGKLSTDECFKYAVSFDPPMPPDPVCIADGVVYEVDVPTLRVQDVNDPTRYVEIDAGAEIIFMNHLNGGNHFHMFQLLAKDAPSIALMNELPRLCVDCVPKPQISTTVLPTIQCTNSQWP